MSRKTRKRRSADGGSSWISYSDMMASLLLVFVLVICYSMYQYFSTLETKTAELNEKENTLAAQTLLLNQKETELQTALISISDQQAQIDAQSLTLEEQKALLAASQAALALKEQDLADAQTALSAQQSALSAAQIQLSAQQQVLDNQQKQIDDLIGVRTQIIQDLSKTLASANLNATVDAQTGDIVLESTVFFDTASNTIKESGQELLSRFVPLYLSVLLSPEYSSYLGEIIIEGHTDTAGSYIYNLELSQQRALSVAKFCLELPSLTESQQTVLRSILTAKGRSFSDPVYNADGSVNMVASRRVEFKFRLKDSEMISQMSQILSD